MTLHPLEDGDGWKFQVHSRPYGVRDVEWSLNADGTAVAGAVEDGGRLTRQDPIDAAIERMKRMRPQELFETFADMELSWGPNWSGSLKSLWLGEGEAIGDISVGEELSEHLGSEPMHPVLMDLCTGVAFPAFPALLAAEQGLSDLFLPLRYGQVMLKEKMPRRFYCRARWHANELDAETQVFDLDFVDRDGRILGGIREFTVKRAPREALLRGLGGDATRLLYTLGWHEVPPAPSDDAGSLRGIWLIAGFDELAAELAGLHLIRPEYGPGAVGAASGSVVTSAVCRSPASSGAAPARVRESRVLTLLARLETEIAYLLSAVHTAAGRQGGETSRRTVDRHRTGGGDRIRRAGRSRAGGAVGTRAHHRQRGACPALQAGRRRRIRAGRAAAGRSPRRTDGRTRTRAAARKVLRVTVAAVGAQRQPHRAAGDGLRSGCPRSAVRSTTCASPRPKCRRRTRATCRCGLRPRV